MLVSTSAFQRKRTLVICTMLSTNQNYITLSPYLEIAKLYIICHIPIIVRETNEKNYNFVCFWCF